MEKTNFKGTRGDKILSISKYSYGKIGTIHDVREYGVSINFGNKDKPSFQVFHFNNQHHMQTPISELILVSDLPELLKQRNEMLDMLEHTVNALYMAGSKGDLILAKDKNGK